MLRKAIEYHGKMLLNPSRFVCVLFGGSVRIFSRVESCPIASRPRAYRFKLVRELAAVNSWNLSREPEREPRRTSTRAHTL